MSGRAIFLSLAFIVALGWLAARWMSSAIPPPEPPGELADGGVRLPDGALPGPSTLADAGRLGAPGPNPGDDPVTAVLAAGSDAGDPQLLALLRGAAERVQMNEFLARNAEAAEKHVDEFCQQSKLAREERLFGEEPPRHKDAAQFMTVRVDWEDDARPLGLLHLSVPLTERLRGYGDDWPTRVTEADVQGLDFSWLRQLHDYDHWNVLTGDGPVRDANDTAWFKAPIPNFTVLQQWTKLRLARALATGEFAQASDDVRHLAALLHSTDLLIADMVGVLMLRLERRAHDVAQAAGQDVSGWKVPTTEALDRYRGLGLSARFFAYPGVAPAVVKKAMACNATAKCSAWYEANSARASLKAWATDDGVAFEALSRESGCDPEVLRRFSQVKSMDAVEAARTFPNGRGPVAFLPDAGLWTPAATGNSR